MNKAVLSVVTSSWAHCCGLPASVYPNILQQLKAANLKSRASCYEEAF
jgi:hypothetical protein